MICVQVNVHFVNVFLFNRKIKIAVARVDKQTDGVQGEAVTQNSVTFNLHK